MSTFTKHNKLEVPTVGTKNWDARVNENTTLMEQGSTIKAVAGLSVSISEVGYLDANNEWAKAKAGPIAIENRWLGFFASDINQNAEGYVRYSGYQKNEAWSFTPGLVWLSDSIAGAVTQTEPTSSIIVGSAIGTNELLIKPWSVPPDVDLYGVNPGEGHITILAWSVDSVPVGNTWSMKESISPHLYTYAQNAGGAADGDTLRYKAYLAAGVYTFKLLYGKANNRGILELHINGEFKGGPWDAYQSSQGWNYVATETGIVIATSGLKDIDLVINGKNASSDNYYMIITILEFWRTS